ncbi:hypothetical protein JFT60_08260 [Pseudomonas sp. MF6772]|jgi:hypothetical protein|uniref:Uncharacterized protein n=1 Tax=Pseudomonas shahriarae TaxID=2745512 RepID=A0ABT5NEM7_9PSED|nr:MULTISPECIES: hypothetical protein [Pseudomonas]SUD44762.1 Uncharacterised protein [Pseudomonas fluorescens]MBJ2267362.1 hypothetical protein [Pseudomonas sp. MF6772]MBL7227047.1 hypothetical protein [Pseudomonas sp.]MCU0209071.1 hypothetical protein [Pseudomonas shahriarae]MDD0986968.1 hypothetical protein [Pseudomonas shahriarae]
MSVQAQQLSPAQQKALYPKALSATGTFDAFIDTISVHFQTLTLVHDHDAAIYRLLARHADNAVTVEKITIELPDTIRNGQVLELDKWQSNKVNVWYAVKSPTIHYVVRCSSGTLIINNLEAGIIKISGTLNGTTDEDVNGNPHTLEVGFDVTS